VNEALSQEFNSMTSKMRTALISLGAAVFCASVVASCGTTSMQSAWKDETYQTTPKKIMVIGVAKNPGKRRFYEDQFASVLQKRGIGAIPSYQHFAGDGRMDSTAAIAKMQELGADAVLVTRLLDKKTVETYYPPSVTYMGPSYYPSYYGGWYGYYSYDYMTTPGYTAVEDYYYLETNLYDLGTRKLVYSGLSETTISSSASESVVKEVVQIISESMVQKKVIP
jgi:hypothetical protein